MIFLLELCDKFVVGSILLGFARRLFGFLHIFLSIFFGVFKKVLLFQQKQFEPFLSNSTFILLLLLNLLSLVFELYLLIHGISLVFVIFFLIRLLIHTNFKHEFFLVPLLFDYRLFAVFFSLSIDSLIKNFFGKLLVFTQCNDLSPKSSQILLMLILFSRHRISGVKTMSFSNASTVLFDYEAFVF